jgi:hypothetical protein
VNLQSRIARFVHAWDLSTSGMSARCVDVLHPTRRRSIAETGG